MSEDELTVAAPRRVRHEMADSLLVMGFSLAASLAVALLVAVTARVL